LSVFGEGPPVKAEVIAARQLLPAFVVSRRASKLADASLTQAR
jgi:hypothetical protein